jgi:hypothetical protein
MRAKTHPGLTFEQAAAQLVEEEKKAGTFQSSSRWTVPGTSIGIGKKTKPVGMSRENPVASFPQKKDLRAGRWYTTPKGVLKWDGKEFTDPLAEEED